MTTQTADDPTGAILARMLRGRLAECYPRDDGLWDVEIEGIAPYTLDLLEGRDDDFFDYVLLETENDEERGYHNELIIMARSSGPHGDAVTIEGQYRRPLGDNNDHADATFFGTAALSFDDETSRRMSRLYAQRVVDAAAEMIENAGNMLRTALAFAETAKDNVATGELPAELSAISRIVCDLEVGRAA